MQGTHTLSSPKEMLFNSLAWHHFP